MRVCSTCTRPVQTARGSPSASAKASAAPVGILLVDQAIVYDIAEQMTDAAGAIAHYTTKLDLSWLGARLPHPVRRSLIVSADRDLITHEVPALRARFGAVAGDWESGAIAWVAARNAVRCLILRGVSDLVGPSGAEAYESLGVFVKGATRVLARLFAHLPAWVALGLGEPATFENRSLR